MRIYVVIVAALVAVLAASAALRFAYVSGRQAAQSEFADQLKKENEHAGTNAEDWRDRLRACDDSGGMFDFASGTCDH